MCSQKYNSCCTFRYGMHERKKIAYTRGKECLCCRGIAQISVRLARAYRLSKFKPGWEIVEHRQGIASQIFWLSFYQKVVGESSQSVGIIFSFDKSQGLQSF